MPRTGLTTEEIRTKAISFALDMTRQMGAEKLRLVDVARAMDISHAALYAHFANKAALFDAVMHAWLEETELGVGKVLQSEAPAREKLLLWFETLYRIKRERVLSDPKLFHAFESAMVHRTDAAMHHVNKLVDEIETLVAALDMPFAPGNAALLMFEATMPFHQPHLMEVRPEEDRSDRLHAILTALMKGWGAP